MRQGRQSMRYRPLNFHLLKTITNGMATILGKE
jgi:hypothetical protein